MVRNEKRHESFDLVDESSKEGFEEVAVVPKAKPERRDGRSTISLLEACDEKVECGPGRR